MHTSGLTGVHCLVLGLTVPRICLYRLRIRPCQHILLLCNQLVNTTVFASRHLLPLCCNHTQYHNYASCYTVVSTMLAATIRSPLSGNHTGRVFSRGTGQQRRTSDLLLQSNLARFQPRAIVHRHSSHAHVAWMTESSRWAYLSVYAASFPSEIRAREGDFGTRAASNNVSDIPTRCLMFNV